MEYLEANLFKYNRYLHYINLSKNKMRHIDSAAFYGLYNLEHINLHEIGCIDAHAYSKTEVLTLISKATENCQNSVLKVYYEKSESVQQEFKNATFLIL